jgi:glycosyltransferase involved in cell wall biosynthesis
MHIKNLKIQRILFLCNHATYFCSHRLPIAKTLIQSGIEVSLFCGSKLSDESLLHSKIRNDGIDLHVSRHNSGSTNIIFLLIFFIEFFIHTHKYKPDILHCISMKSVFISMVYKKIFKNTQVVFAISGLGSIFTEDCRESPFRKVRKFLIFRLLKMLSPHHGGGKFIVQNQTDKKFLRNNLNINDSDIYVIPGSGVKFSNFLPSQFSEKKKIVLMASRLLENKGVREYLLVVNKLKKKFPKWDFLLAGVNDLDSPAAFDQNELDRLISVSGCRYLGHVHDVGKLLEPVAIFVLPSYREGFPKAIIEAGVAGCAIVTTDVPGCRDSVKFGETGLLVKPRDSVALEAGITTLINDKHERNKYASSMQLYSLENFSIDDVIKQHFLIYESF